MALAAMYKVNNVSYYEGGVTFSGVFTDTLQNLLDNNDSKLDYSIFLNCGCDWSYLNRGALGSHFSLYPDWVSGVLAVRQGPAPVDIKYVGSAIMSKSNTSKVFNITKQQGDTTAWKNARFMIDVVNTAPGTASQYNSFDYQGYNGIKYGFNSCYIQGTGFYCTSNTAYSGTFINNYESLTGDNAKRMIRSTSSVILTNYNPYLSDSSSLGNFSGAYIYDFFEINGELIGVRDPVDMPNSDHWQSWVAYSDGGTKYVTIGEYGSNVTVGSQGALPANDNVKGLFSFNHNGTSQNCFSTINAVSYNINCYGIRWVVGNTTITTAKTWRDNIRLGVMSADGIIDHDAWLVGEAAINASDNPNKNTDYDHIPAHGGGGGGSDEDNTDPVSTAGAPFGTGLAHYYVTTVDSAVLGQISEALGTWDIDTSKKDLYRNLISCKIIKPPAGIPSTPSTFEIYGVKPQYNGADISIPAVNGNPDITFGPYSISRKFNDFRDYAPYTRAEIFLPYCGWCALPSHVVGRSVSVSYFTDVIAGTVKAVVFCGENPVAEAAGVMAYDIPFAAQNVGAKIQAANTGMLAYGKAALQLSAGIGQAVATKGKQGMSSIVNGAFGVAAGYNQLSMAANENYTEISGKAGDGCALAGIDTIIIKIVRPKYGAYPAPPYVPDGFAHTVGFLSMKQAKVSAASGLILCDNVDTSGIGKATDAERAEIKRVLETGLYINNPPE